MKKFTILGERCSGTNFLEKAISNNFELKLTWEYGWKHFFGFSDYSNADDVLFIGIVRDPIQWLCSLYKNPHHLNQEMRKNWINFLTKECWSYYDIEVEDNKLGDEIMTDRNIYTGNRYKNIFELREIKIDFLLTVMPKKVKNYILIRYEDFLNNYEETLNLIEHRFLLKRKTEDYQKITAYKGESGTFIPKKYNIPEEFMPIVQKNLDHETEKNVGYKI